MPINPSVLERMIQVGVQRQVAELEAGRGSPQDIMRFALEVPSTHKSEDYAWLLQLPQAREWIGPKRIKELADAKFQILNRAFEATIGISQHDIDDDQAGAFDLMIRLLVDAMMEKPRSLISDLIVAGTSGLAYDGVAFFSNVSGARIIDNLLAGTGTTLAQISADLDSVRAAMMAFVFESGGSPLNIVFDAIYCPPALTGNFERIFQSRADPTATAGTDTYNPWSGKAVVIPDARLSDGTDWYAARTGGILRPLVWQKRSAPKGVLDDSHVKSDHMIDVSAEMRGNVGYGLPQLMVKVVNS